MFCLNSVIVIAYAVLRFNDFFIVKFVMGILSYISLKFMSITAHK